MLASDRGQEKKSKGGKKFRRVDGNLLIVEHFHNSTIILLSTSSHDSQSTGTTKSPSI